MPLNSQLNTKGEDIAIMEKNRVVNCTVWNNANSKKVIIIAPAMGVARRFYKTIATHFFNLSYSVISLDYYGMLEYNNQEQSKISLCDWGFKDIDSVIEYASQQFPNKSLYFLGHSIAGQVFPLAENSCKIKAAYLVASQNVSIENWSGLSKLKVNFFWYFVIPFCIRVFGHVPGIWYGGKHILHKPIAEDWAKWGKSKAGILSIIPKATSRYKNFKVPTKFLSFSDDEMLAPLKAVEHIYESYGSPIKEHEHIYPESLGMTSIGHFNFFKKECAFLWSNIDSWFKQLNND